MRLKTEKIRGRMAEVGISQAKLREYLENKGINITRATLGTRLRGQSDFRCQELLSIFEILGITDYSQYIDEE